MNDNARLTFELEALEHATFTQDVFEQLLRGLRHDVAYVREGALYGCAGHMQRLSVREQVRVLAQHDPDADVREIAGDMIAQTEGES